VSDKAHEAWTSAREMPEQLHALLADEAAGAMDPRNVANHFGDKV
jgi:hypothetical protein